MAPDALSRAGRVLLLLGIAYATARVVSRAVFPRGASNDDSKGAVRFVHVPKTGGAAVVLHLRRRHGCPAMDGGGHDITERDALARSQLPIIVLREPLERLNSAFE